MERKIAIMCPSRNRRGNVEAVYNTWKETNTGLSVLYPVIDADNVEDYDPRILELEYMIAPPKNMNYATNWAADILKDKYTHIMFIGDDHHFRTPGWDKILLDKSAEYRDTVVMYCDDLLQRQALATEVVLTSDIVRAVGYYSIPELIHLWMDNYWMSLGNGIDRLVYVPEVVVEHMHFANGKAIKDANYLRVSTGEIHNHDQSVFMNWVGAKRDEDIAKIKEYCKI